MKSYVVIGMYQDSIEEITVHIDPKSAKKAYRSYENKLKINAANREAMKEDGTYASIEESELYPPEIKIGGRPRRLPNRAEDEHSPTPTNDEHAHTAASVLAVFAAETNLDPENELDCIVGDFLANLGHFCDRTGIDLQERLNNARMHYNAETQGRGAQFTRSN